MREKPDPAEPEGEGIFPDGMVLDPPGVVNSDSILGVSLCTVLCIGAEGGFFKKPSNPLAADPAPISVDSMFPPPPPDGSCVVGLFVVLVFVPKMERGSKLVALPEERSCSWIIPSEPTPMT